MQSNFGIVTKMGVWLMPYPEVYMPLWLRVWRDEDLAAVIDILRTLMLDGTIRMVPADHEHDPARGGVLARATSGGPSPGRSPTTSIDKMARELEVGRWIMRFALYDDEAVVDHQFEKIKAAFASDRRRRGLGHEGRAGGHPVARAPGRAHPGRRAEPRLERDDRLVRRRGGRPHRLLADRAAGRAARRSRCATCCAA